MFLPVSAYVSFFFFFFFFFLTCGTRAFQKQFSKGSSLSKYLQLLRSAAFGEKHGLDANFRQSELYWNNSHETLNYPPLVTRYQKNGIFSMVHNSASTKILIKSSTACHEVPENQHLACGASLLVLLPRNSDLPNAYHEVPENQHLLYGASLWVLLPDCTRLGHAPVDTSLLAFILQVQSLVLAFARTMKGGGQLELSGH